MKHRYYEENSVPTEAKIEGFFDSQTNTISYILWCPQTRAAAIIDSVLDYDAAAGRTSTESADKLVSFSKSKGLNCCYILETHAHADHMSAAPYLQRQLGGQIGIGTAITQTQKTFAPFFFESNDAPLNGTNFDILLNDGDTLPLGELTIRVMSTPGHTPACVSYQVSDNIFVGDTLFMPDSGTARADFPGGDAAQLYQSIHKILSLPDHTKIYVCHDYQPEGRLPLWQTTVAEEKEKNIHVGGNRSQAEFVSLREARDRTLSLPDLILPAIQVNIAAGHLPAADQRGRRHLKIPLNQF